MVLVIRIRPRQIERCVLIGIILLLVASNLYMYMNWKPAKNAVDLVAPDEITQETTLADNSAGASGDDFEILNVSQLEDSVAEEKEAEKESEPEPEPEPQKPVETCSDNKKNQDETDVDCGGVCKACPEPEEEEEESSGPSDGTVTISVDSLDWKTDSSKDFGHLTRIDFTIENGLDTKLSDPQLRVYLYDDEDPEEIKSSYHKINLYDVLDFTIEANERVIAQVFAYDPNTKTGMSGFKRVDNRKTVKVKLYDKGTDTDVVDIVKETP